MPRSSKSDSVREQRILMEIVVDAYAPDERAMGWYYYLEGKVSFPFTARCTTQRAISPLRVKDEVEVIGMAPEQECGREMFVMIRWERDGLAVPLSQLRCRNNPNQTSPEARYRGLIIRRMGRQFVGSGVRSM